MGFDPKHSGEGHGAWSRTVGERGGAGSDLNCGGGVGPKVGGCWVRPELGGKRGKQSATRSSGDGGRMRLNPSVGWGEGGRGSISAGPSPWSLLMGNLLVIITKIKSIITQCILHTT